ncbi:hypothetical protein PR202_gb29674 [Eleusine coracana subsp. coracana]|uniref:Uncharacterized protein n=1 Tax=Eleusine coracana subsp. coracana TaxID=191504 RepID=A0AAV5G009_ELECO|nr:hypothetical protein QOZ80_6AG0541530 [Eleusine coracana subsp. coracana]KAK3133825.1 hypothetical protein QOZ80_6AG0541580 [Eleusine coracana subsp. coracana]GJN40459.1 hypothetical protein PR202_gb29674 [Eleusine coracana subsp. coracana]
MAPVVVPGSAVHVRVLSRRLVKASEFHNKSHPEVVTVSNLDLIPNMYQASLLCIYPKPPTGAADFDAIVGTFETHLPSFLNHFITMTGRVVMNPSSGLPEVHCLNQGTELVVGEAGVPLKSLDFSLAEESTKRILLPFDEDVPLSVQVVSFTCGGFSVSWSCNNLVVDGHSVAKLARMWSEFARSSGTKTFTEPPTSYDRSIFRPREPPTYSDALNEMFTPYDHRHLVNVLTAEDSFVDKLYYVEAQDLERLRAMAASNGGEEGQQQRVSRVQAFSAYLWKSMAALVAASKRVSKDDDTGFCRMGYWVDARFRVKSPKLQAAMRNYVGNAVPYVAGEAAAGTLLNKPLAEVAAMVREIITGVDYDERVQEMVDWVEVHKPQKVVESASIGLGNPTISQTVWASFPLDSDFGFGHASIAMPTWASERLCSGNVIVTTHPGGNGSWLVSAYLWPRLADALEADHLRIFKPLTADYLGV